MDKKSIAAFLFILTVYFLVGVLVGIMAKEYDIKERERISTPKEIEWIITQNGDTAWAVYDTVVHKHYTKTKP